MKNVSQTKYRYYIIDPEFRSVIGTNNYADVEFWIIAPEHIIIDAYNGTLLKGTGFEFTSTPIKEEKRTYGRITK